MPKKNDFYKETETLRSLQVLEEIDKNPSLSQRDLALRLGVALGIANACVHTLVRKGLVKIRGDNNRSVTYHLTKSGLVQKSELALKWTMNTIGFYGEARTTIAVKLAELAGEGIRTIVFYGANELAEIGAIVASECGLEVVGFVGSSDSPRTEIVGRPVEPASIIDDRAVDAVVVCFEPDRSGLEKLEQFEARGVKICRLV